MNKNIIIIIIVAALVIIGSYFLLMGNVQAPSQQANNQSSNNSTNQTNNSPTVQNSTHEVMYTDSGYSPAELAIKLGDTVVFINQSSKDVWTASAMHPSHIVYSGTALQQHCPDTSNAAFDECNNSKPGEAWSFTFNKSGIWGYHNHLNASHFGKIVVE